MFLPTLLQSNLQKGLFHLYSQTIKICSAGYAVPLRKCTRTAGDTKEWRCGVLVFRSDLKLLIDFFKKNDTMGILHYSQQLYSFIAWNSLNYVSIRNITYDLIPPTTQGGEYQKRFRQSVSA